MVSPELLVWCPPNSLGALALRQRTAGIDSAKTDGICPQYLPLEHQTFKVRQLIDDYRAARIVIPEFQREYVWRPAGPSFD